MVTVLDPSTVTPEEIAPGAIRQTLLGSEACGVVIDRVTLQPGASTTLDVTPKSIAWLIALEGEAGAKTPHIDGQVTESGSMFLPPGWRVTLSAQRPTTVLAVEVADVLRLDPTFSAQGINLMVIDWMAEPLLECDSDGRRRVPIVSQETCGIQAVKIEMVLYPAGAAAPKLRRKGAATMICVVTGQGVFRTDGRDIPLKPGSFVHVPDGEWNELRCLDGGGLRFIQIDAPGAFKTEWADPGQATRWRRSSFDVRGRRQIPDDRPGFPVST
jgi:quercetin dioxygenase-like cupin family protein